MSDNEVELQITDVNNVTCPTCSRQVTTYESRPKGPVSITTLDCGHRVDRIVWTQEALDQQASNRPF